jgi:hypothetical protein
MPLANWRRAKPNEELLALVRQRNPESLHDRPTQGKHRAILEICGLAGNIPSHEAAPLPPA